MKFTGPAKFAQQIPNIGGQGHPSPIPSSGILRILPTMILLWTNFAFGGAQIAPSNVSNSLLEEKIWLSDDDDLANLETSVTRLLQENPRSTHAHYLLAQLYLRKFKHSPSQLRLLQQASVLGQQAIDLDPNAEEGYLIAAQVMDLMGYSDTAISTLDERDAGPNSATWRTSFTKGLILGGQGPSQEALLAFRESMDARQGDQEIIVPHIIAELHSDSRGEKLLTDLSNWNSSHPHKLFDLSIAAGLSESGKYREAHKIYSKLRKKYPDMIEASINDAILLYSHLGGAEEAGSLLTDTLKKNDKFPKQRLSLINAHLASIRLTSRKTCDSVCKNLFLKAVEDSENTDDLLSFIKTEFARSKKLNEFVSLLDDVSLKIGGSGFFYALNGEVLSESLGSYERAVESFKSAIVLEPQRSEFYNGLGLTYYRMQAMDEALSMFHEAAKIDPQNATSKYNEACVLALLGRTDEALGSLKSAIDLDPRLQDSAKADKDFENLRKTEGFLTLTGISQNRTATIEPEN